MDDTTIIRRVLQAVREALERVRDPALDVSPDFVEQLDRYRESLERRLGTLEGSAASTAPPPRPSGPLAAVAGVPRAMPERG